MSRGDARSARTPRLRRSDCSRPGLRRVRRGRGFGYQDRSGQRVLDDAALARIRDLAIPPAWTDVWICEDALGHLQATGVDAAGRKQYVIDLLSENADSRAHVSPTGEAQRARRRTTGAGRHVCGARYPGSLKARHR